MQDPPPSGPSRRAPSARERALHDAAVAAGEVSYRDPRTGLSVLTAPFLAGQGRCCERRCRHCPWAEPPKPAGDDAPPTRP